MITMITNDLFLLLIDAGARRPKDVRD